MKSMLQLIAFKYVLILSIALNAFANIDYTDFSTVGAVESIDLKDEINRSLLIKMVTNPDASTSYNRGNVVHLLRNIEKYPNLELVGYRLKTNNSYKKEWAGFSVLEKIGNKESVVLFFTAAGDRNKAWASVLSRYVAKKTGTDHVNFLHNDFLGTGWEKFFVSRTMVPRTQENLSLLENSNDKMKFNQCRLVHKLTFSYQHPDYGQSVLIDLLPMSPVILPANIGMPAQQRSLFTDFKARPVMIIVTGEPAAGKNTSFEILQERFDWLRNFDVVDIDKFSEPRIEQALAGINFIDLSEEEQKNILKEPYERAWEEFVLLRDQKLDEGKNIALFVTGRQENLIPDYKAIAGGYRIVTFAISVSDRSVLKARAHERELKSKRPVPFLFAELCRKSVPPAQHHHEEFFGAPAAHFFNDWTKEKPTDLFLASLKCSGNGACDVLWQNFVGEPTYWAWEHINDKTTENTNLALKAFVFGLGTIQ